MRSTSPGPQHRPRPTPRKESWSEGLDGPTKVLGDGLPADPAWRRPDRDGDVSASSRGFLASGRALCPGATDHLASGLEDLAGHEGRTPRVVTPGAMATLRGTLTAWNLPVGRERFFGVRVSGEVGRDNVCTTHHTCGDATAVRGRPRARRSRTGLGGLRGRRNYPPTTPTTDPCSRPLPVALGMHVTRGRARRTRRRCRSRAVTSRSSRDRRRRARRRCAARLA